jgi:hypothetical protein
MAMDPEPFADNLAFVGVFSENIMTQCNPHLSIKPANHKYKSAGARLVKSVAPRRVVENHRNMPSTKDIISSLTELVASEEEVDLYHLGFNSALLKAKHFYERQEGVDFESHDLESGKKLYNGFLFR